MKIAALVYDFPHSKSVDGLLYLKANGFKDVKVIAAPFKKLEILKSKIRITPIIEPLHPRDVTRGFDYEYVCHDHDDKEMPSLLKDCDLGLIFGARILKRHVTESLRIINAHPGLLPWNRNSDNIKWAVMHSLPQAVTTHIVDEHVDRGFLIEQRGIDVFPDDSLLDIFIRLRNLELKMLIRSINEIKHVDLNVRLDKGHYNYAMDMNTEMHLDIMFENYKKNYAKIRKTWGV